MHRRMWSLLLAGALVLMLLGAPAGAAPPPDGLQAVTGESRVLPRGADLDAEVEVVVEFAAPPVAREHYQREQAGQSFTKVEQKAHSHALKAEHDRFLSDLKGKVARVMGQYTVAYNGLYVRVRKADLPELAQAPGVVAVHLVRPIYLEPDNSTSVPFVGARNVWENVLDPSGRRVTGEGIRVAVIDTGIDYTHADLGGSGSPADYAGNDPTVIEPGTFPTAKVVDGWDFVGSEYDAGSPDPALRVPHPDPDPLDENGHGSHVAGTIAGLGTVEIGPGMAPGALLYAYKVFGKTGSTAVVAQAIERALDPNGDGSMEDRVDVINMSLGSPFGSPGDPSAVAAENAALAGVVVVASAGNSGNIPYITGSPAVAPDAISVAASVDNGIVADGIRINSPESIAGLYEAAEGAITVPLKQTGPVTGDLFYVGLARASDPMPPELAGRIALIDRGAVTFREKLLSVQAGGAIAAVVANNVPGDPIVMGGDPTGITIPGVMVSMATGDLIKSALAGGAAVNVTLSPDIKIPKPQLADTLAAFTSRGPARPGSDLKPDLAAPGFNITSVAFRTGTGSATFSGTSMAAPHVAGAAALLLQAHPDWTPALVKAALMETAVQTRNLDGDPYPMSLQGAGRIRVDRAVLAPALVLPSSLSLGYVPATREPVHLTRTLTLLNQSAEQRTFRLSWSFRTPAQEDGAVAFELPGSVTVKAGGRARVTVRAVVDPARLPDTTTFREYDGYLTFTDTASDFVLQVPFHVVPQRQSDVEGSLEDVGGGEALLALENGGSATGRADLFVLGGKDRHERYLPPESDLRYAGARPLGEGAVVEFLVATWGPWATPNTVEFNVCIDTDGDGDHEYIVFNGDVGYLLGAGYQERQVSAVYEVATGKVHLQYYVRVGGTYNQSVMGLPVSTARLGGATAFHYWVVSWDRDTDIPDFMDRGYVPFDATAPGVVPAWWTVAVPPGGQVDVDLVVAPGAGNLLLAYPTDRPDHQAQVVELCPGKKGTARECARRPCAGRIPRPGGGGRP